MQILKPILIICLISCSNHKQSQSNWEKQESNFKYQDKTEFIIDSSLRATYKQLPKADIDIFGKKADNVYLYSWQSRDNTKNEFTIIKDEDEHGLHMYYLFLDKKDSLISSTKIAGMGGEGGFLFESRSKFLNKVTLLNISSITLMHDAERRLKKPLGDSTYSHLLIDKTGKMERKKIREVYELQFDKVDE